MTRFSAFAFVATTIVFTIYGQLVIKWQAALAGVPPADWRGRLDFMLHIAFNPWIISGLLAALVAGAAWIVAMTKLPISVAYPLMALTFPSVVLLSHYIFGEELTAYKLVGIALIISGVSIVNT
jgi:multidrug transporter EmrE-like cation transporter